MNCPTRAFFKVLLAVVAYCALPYATIAKENRPATQLNPKSASQLAEHDLGKLAGTTHKPNQTVLALADDDGESPEIAGKKLRIEVDVDAAKPRGVALCQGGQQNGYCIHFAQGKATFDVRVNGKLMRVQANEPVTGRIQVLATLDADKMAIRINGGARHGQDGPGLIPAQPKDQLTVGYDDLSTVGNYQGPNEFNGKVVRYLVTTINPTNPEDRKQTEKQDLIGSDLLTRWGEDVRADNAWTEYPRPQMKRDQWTNLNGHWNYAVTDNTQTDVPEDWQGKILVPFCLESKLGGVGRLLDGSEALWYQRSFEADKEDSQRTLLNFEAVDYRCEIFVNQKLVGKHVGGNTPFSFDITEPLVDGSNHLVIRVEDTTDGYQLRGKQKLNARGIWYTRVSGIWQTVWLETVPTSHIEDLKLSTSAKNGTITVAPQVAGNANYQVRVKDGDKLVAQAKGSGSTTLKIENAKRWSPASPHLYDIEVRLLSDGQAGDTVTSYAGIRDVGKVQDADGHWRFTLNGKIIFHWGPLDQGWWPDGLLTPPSDEAMLFDIRWLKQAGFNMIRKHIKVEPRRYYYHCDRLGMMVWQDHVSGGPFPKWTRLEPNPEEPEWPESDHQQFMQELEWMIDSLENHPSIVSWVPFNERWGQHRTMEVGKWTVERDPSRIINIASGGNFYPVGDVVDEHRYPHPGFPFELGKGGRFDAFIKVMGEFGGHGFPVAGHLWDPNKRNWGYGDLPKTKQELKDRYVHSIELLDELRRQGIAGGVYTQTTDVEGEVNGLMTYDRKVIKISAEELNKLHQRLYSPLDSKDNG